MMKQAKITLFTEVNKVSQFNFRSSVVEPGGAETFGWRRRSKKISATAPGSGLAPDQKQESHTLILFIKYYMYKIVHC
jgi:hypothetical protein